jgi:hypothetical protein
MNKQSSLLPALRRVFHSSSSKTNSNMQKGRGRKAGESHNRRTDVEIRKDERESQVQERRKEIMQAKCDEHSRSNFFGASQKHVFFQQERKRLVKLRAANPRFGKQGEADLKALAEIANAARVNHPPVLEDQSTEPLQDDPLTEDNGNADNQELLPSVNMSRVPSIFRQQIAGVLLGPSPLTPTSVQLGFPTAACDNVNIERLTNSKSVLTNKLTCLQMTASRNCTHRQNSYKLACVRH